MSLATRGAPSCDLPALRRRPGERPRTTPHAPHSQLDQLPDAETYEALALRLTGLPGVTVGPALRAPLGSIGLSLADPGRRGPPDAFLLGDEFAHLHPAPEASLHTVLPRAVRLAVIERGWGEPHPLAGALTVSPATLMLYAPCGRTEVGLVAEFVDIARAWAMGELGDVR
jgi:hypothetical protein